MTDYSPDPSTDDAIRAAFAQLRVAEQPRVTPPGVAAARRTTRGRRQRRLATTGAAAVTAAMLLGAGLLTAGDQPGPDRGPAPVAAPADPDARQPGPAGDQDDRTGPDATAPAGRDGLQRRVRAALGDVPMIVVPDARPDAVATSVPVGYPAAGWGAPDPSAGEPRTFQLRVTRDFLLRVGCGGTGSLTLRLKLGDEVTATGTARCGTTAEEIAAGVAEVPLTVEDPRSTPLSLEWSGTDPDGSPEVLAVTLIPQE